MGHPSVSGPVPQRNGNGNGSGNKVHNASEASAPSEMTVQRQQSYAQSRMTGGYKRQPFKGQYCKLSNMTRHDLNLGDVISVPFHTPNTDHKATNNDPNMSETRHGWAYSKRRMAIVLYIHGEVMFCLPFFSFQGRGIGAKPKDIIAEYACVRNDDDTHFINGGVHEPVAVNMNHPVDDKTTVHLTGGFMVECKADISKIGRVPKKSYFALTQLWKNSIATAARDAYKE
jgi:hypothetical protein